MDITKFTEKRTGQLVPLESPQDHAFIPDSLPPEGVFDVALWPLLSEAKKYLGMLDGNARTLKNPQLLLRPLQTWESITSSRLEGTYATVQELMLFELNPKDSSNSMEDINAWREVANYNRALATGYRMLEDLPFCVRLLKDLHETLLLGVRGHNKNPGAIRQHQVHLGSNRRYVPPPVAEIEKCLNDLEHYINAADEKYDPLVRCFLVHYQVEAIHPFSDGNGRIGRVFLSLMIYKWCELKMPWLYLSPFFERYKDEYIDNMFKVSTEGNWSRWIEFCLNGVIQQAKDAIKKCDSLQALREEMHARAQGGSSRIHGIIEGLFDYPFLRTAELAKRNSVQYQTAQADVEHLIEKQILKEVENVKIKTFFAPQILEIVHSEKDA